MNIKLDHKLHQTGSPQTDKPWTRIGDFSLREQAARNSDLIAQYMDMIRRPGGRPGLMARLVPAFPAARPGPRARAGS